MRVFIFVSLFCAQLVAAQTFVDQVSGSAALVCSDDSGEWVCKPVPIELLIEEGMISLEGLVIMDAPTLEHFRSVVGEGSMDFSQLELDSNSHLFERGAE